jgi:cellulose synthase/poly-beta-1,6-N-acetylglucosamine synthase-like glycosyltransferase
MATSLCHSLVRHTFMEPIVLVIAFLFLLVYAGLIIYYRQSWLSISDFRFQILDFKPVTKISVIIPSRNEGQNIGTCLDSIVSQSYPKDLFEILVVDDHSTDNTAEIILGYQSQNVKLISLKDFITTNQINSYKKKAIEIAIQQADGQLIVTTDADCTVPQNWLQTIAAFYQKKKPDLMVMPVAIDCRNRFIEIFQALDFMTLQGITGASVHKKFHSMCNGANLAYTKKAFNTVNGFKDIDNIASGDDMLLMHKIYKQNPNGIAYLKNKDVIVQTAPVKTIGEFFNQRIRWASKADKYEDKRIFGVLLVVYLFNLLLLLMPFISIFSNIEYSIFNIQCSMLGMWLLLLLLKTVTELFFLFPVAQFFNKQLLLWWFPLLQPFHIIYTVIAGWLGKFGNYKWKGRNVK